MIARHRVTERGHFSRAAERVARAREVGLVHEVVSVASWVLAFLAAVGGDKRAAAEMLGLSLKTVYNKLKSRGGS